MILWNDIQMGKVIWEEVLLPRRPLTLYLLISHGSNEEHNVIVLKGSVRVEYENGKYDLLPVR
jgi:hypothetical protein